MCSMRLGQHLPAPGEGRTGLGEDSHPGRIRLAGHRKHHIPAAGNHRICI